MTAASRSLRIKLPRIMRRFYEGRELTTLACRCLLNESIRLGMHGFGPSSADWRREEKRVGRRLK